MNGLILGSAHLNGNGKFYDRRVDARVRHYSDLAVPSVCAGLPLGSCLKPLALVGSGETPLSSAGFISRCLRMRASSSLALPRSAMLAIGRSLRSSLGVNGFSGATGDAGGVGVSAIEG